MRPRHSCIHEHPPLERFHAPAAFVHPCTSEGARSAGECVTYVTLCRSDKPPGGATDYISARDEDGWERS